MKTLVRTTKRQSKATVWDTPAGELTLKYDTGLYYLRDITARLEYVSDLYDTLTITRPDGNVRAITVEMVGRSVKFSDGTGRHILTSGHYTNGIALIMDVA